MATTVNSASEHDAESGVARRCDDGSFGWAKPSVCGVTAESTSPVGQLNPPDDEYWMVVAGTTSDGRHRLSVHRVTALGDGFAEQEVAGLDLESAPQCLMPDRHRGVLLGRASRNPDGHALDSFALRSNTNGGVDLVRTHTVATFPIPVHLARSARRPASTDSTAQIADPAQSTATDPLIAVSHFWEGQVGLHRWQVDGSLCPVGVIEGFGSSVHERQKTSHAHSSLIIGDDLYVADFGADVVRRYRHGSLAATWVAPPGSGPRHLADVTGGVIAVNTELTNRLHLLDAHSLVEFGGADAHGWSSLPPWHVGHNQASDLTYIADGSIALVGHRGLNGLAVHQIRDGEARATDWIPLRGAPRVIAPGPAGMLAVAAEGNGWVQILRPDTSRYVEAFAFQPYATTTSVSFW
ncbi:MAG: lactonase family protein [Propionibacteriaceae bacterium]|jgi:6-phosphogluconolactonase (cycloisomerase 2 family)|nr:lactonase family protein [Propionibacteriaceae bacterium]